MSGNVKKYREKGYESISRNMLQDIDNLSLQAIGLLSNLTSMPEDWTVYKTELYKRFSKNGRTSVQNAWNELVENSYIIQLRKRNGSKYDYIYYHSQTRFSEESKKEIEKLEGCNIWDGKTSSKKKENKPEKCSNVDFQQSVLDSPKPTDIKSNHQEVYHKDLDTLDTSDTDVHSNKTDGNSMTEPDRQRAKEEYIKKSFYENQEKIPRKLAEMLEVFTSSIEQAEKYYNIILSAKKKVEEEKSEMIWLEDEPVLLEEMINSFVRSLRKVEQHGGITNPEGYMYRTIYVFLSDKIRDRQNFAKKMLLPKNNYNSFAEYLEAENKDTHP